MALLFPFCSIWKKMASATFIGREITASMLIWSMIIGKKSCFYVAVSITQQGQHFLFISKMLSFNGNAKCSMHLLERCWQAPTPTSLPSRGQDSGASLMIGGFFAPTKYILGDFDYQIAPAMVCAFKRTYLHWEKEHFNYYVAKCMVTNKHCIDILESKWHFLKQLWIQLKMNQGNLWCVKWIAIHAKLHNFVMSRTRSRNDFWS